MQCVFNTIIVENRFLLYYKHFLLSDDVSQTKYWISAQSSQLLFSISGNAAARCLVQFVDKGRDIIVTVNIQNPLVAKNKSCKIWHFNPFSVWQPAGSDQRKSHLNFVHIFLPVVCPNAMARVVDWISRGGIA